MKSRILILTAALALLPGLAGSQEGGEMTEAQTMELWAKWGQTDEHHKELGWYVGTWDVEVRGGPKVEKGVSEFKWIIDGRWLGEDYKGTMMGLPYQGHGVIGYDKFKKKWVTTWVGNLDTAMLRFEGVVVDPTGKVKVLWCNMDEYLTGEHDKPAKGVYTRIDEDTFTFDLWDMAAGPDGSKVMEMTYKRRKG